MSAAERLELDDLEIKKNKQFEFLGKTVVRPNIKLFFKPGRAAWNPAPPPGETGPLNVGTPEIGTELKLNKWFCV